MRKCRVMTSKLFDYYSLTLNEKITLTEKIRRLSNEGLAAFVRLLQKECPQACEDLEAERLQIRVDNIDRKTYGNVLDLIESCPEKVK